MKTLKTIVLLIVITITASDAISQRAGIYKDIQFDSLYPLWSYTSYDPTIVGHEIDNPRDLGAEFDGYGHVRMNDNIEQKPIIENNDLYIISKTYYDGDLSGALIEKIDLIDGHLIWQASFDLRVGENREFIERAYLEEGNLVLITYLIITPDPSINVPLLYHSGTMHRGLLKIRKYDKVTGNLIESSQPSAGHPDIKLIAPGPTNDVQCYPIENDQYEIVNFYFRDTFGIRIYIDTLNALGVKVNETDTLWSELKDIDWKYSYWSSSSKFFRKQNGEIYWLDFIAPGEENSTIPQANINVSKNGKLIRQISLNHLNPELKKKWSIRRLVDDNKEIILLTTYSMLDDCTHYFLDFDGNILNQYSLSGGCPLSIPNDITSNDFILPVYVDEMEDNYFFLKFLHFNNDSVNEIPRFKLNEQLYVTVPEKIFKLQNGDYLYFASNREIFEGRVRGKFMTTYRFTHNSIFKEFPKIKETQLFTLYPNPITSGDLLYLYFNNENSGTIEIYNMSGQQVLKEIMVEQKLKAIQIGSLDAGVYNIVFYNGNNIHTEQLIVL